MIWIALKESSKLVLPNLTQLVEMKSEKQDGKVVLDCKKLKDTIAKYKDQIETIEIFRNETSIEITNVPEFENIIKDL